MEVARGRAGVSLSPLALRPDNSNQAKKPGAVLFRLARQTGEVPPAPSMDGLRVENGIVGLPRYDDRELGLQPAEFLQGQSGVPDFCHVDDLGIFKLHDVNVIGARASSRWRNRPPRARVRPVKHAIGRHVVSNLPSSAGLAGCKESFSNVRDFWHV